MFHYYTFTTIALMFCHCKFLCNLHPIHPPLFALLLCQFLRLRIILLATHTHTPIFSGQYTVLKTPLMHQPSSSTPQSILEHITSINARGPLLFSGVSLLSSPFSSFMILAQFETPLKNTAWGAAKSSPEQKERMASLQQALLCSNRCQRATLPHATANQ